MDILEQFLNSISYKFPKGYPDINDPKDMIILENEFKNLGINLTELAINTKDNHWKTRVAERTDILDIINLPEDSPLSKQEIIEEIQSEILPRLSRLEDLQTFPLSKTNNIGYKIFKPILSYGDTKIPLKLKVEYTVKGTKKIGIGFSYIAVISNDTLITLMLLNADDNATIELNMAKHNKRKEYDSSPEIVTASNYEYIISPKSETQITLIDPDTLPYKVKTEYRKGTKFTHDDYGVGTIVATSSGNTGKGDQNGKLD